MTHWIVATMNADMTEQWSVHETFDDAHAAHQDDIADGAYSSTVCVVVESTDFTPPTEWTCEGCLCVVPDGDGHYVDDMRVCEHCADKLTGIS